MDEELIPSEVEEKEVVPSEIPAEIPPEIPLADDEDAEDVPTTPDDSATDPVEVV